MNTINIIGVSVVGVFMLFILMKDEKVLSDYILLSVNILLALILLTDTWIQKSITPLNFIVHNLAPFFLFPAFLTYGMLLIDKTHQLRVKWLWFFSFAIGFTIFLLWDILSLTNYSQELLTQRYEDPNLAYHFFYKGQKIFAVALLFWFLGQLKQYDQSIKSYYSFIEPIQLKWLRNFAIFQIIIYGVSFFSFLAYNFEFVKDISTIYAILNTGIVLAIFYLSFHGIRQYSLAQFSTVITTQNDAEILEASATGIAEESQRDHKTFSLPEDRVNKIYREVLQLFEKDHIYTESSLKVNTLAEKLAVSPHHLSMAINTKTGKPFYDLVNEYRVKSLKQKLQKPENKQFTILSLALDSGFNSKASLNRIFKQHTHLTPSQFQKAHFAK